MNELMTTDTKELSPEQLGGEIRLLTTQARRMALKMRSTGRAAVHHI